MNDNYSAEVKAKLLRRRKELLERHLKIEEDRKREDQPLEKDFSEQATEVENDEVLDRLNEAAYHEIKQIDQALKRIEKGVYGICKECGEEIPRKRLEAVPFTVFCVDCAQMRKKNK